MSQALLRCTRPATSPEIRLLCLPYAGGAASMYREWGRLAPDWLDVRAVELPGRGIRIHESPVERMGPLVSDLAHAVVPLLDRPCALFGHSLGGLIAFELARWLRRHGYPPLRHLFVSATATPGTPPPHPPLRHASDTAVKDRLRTLNGTARPLLEDEALMAMMVPIVRADFSVLETYQYRDWPPLETPITVFGGAYDRVVQVPQLAGWRDQTSAGFHLRLFPGDHFFVNDSAYEVVSAVVEELDTAGVTRPRPLLAGSSGGSGGRWSPMEDSYV